MNVYARTPGERYLYVIQFGSSPIYKIGYAQDPVARLAMLQTGSPLDLTLIAVYEGGHRLEAALHLQLAPQRLRGEWFKFDCDPTVTVEWFIRKNRMPFRRVDPGAIPSKVGST